MKYVIAGIILLVTLLVSLSAYILIPYFSAKNEEKSDNNVTRAITMTTFFQKNNLNRMIFSGGISSICAITTYLLIDGESIWFNICKYLVIAVALVFVMIIDWELHIIPNVIVVGLFFVDILLMFVELFSYRKEFGTLIITKVASLAFCLVLFYALARLTKEGMGIGDVKLIAVLGWMLGFSTTLVVVLFALFICAVVSVVLLIGKKKNKEDTIPFGPFLFFGYILMLIILGI